MSDRKWAHLLALFVSVSALAFGSVYPWAFWPLFLIAAAVGCMGLIRNGWGGGKFPIALRTLARGLVLLNVAAALQLIPLSRPALTAVTPRTPALLDEFSLGYQSTAARRHELSIRPSASVVSLLALSALSCYTLGLAVSLSTETVRAFPIGLTCWATLVALFGILSRVQGNGLVYWVWKSREGGGDICGPFVNRNHFGGWMLMATVISTGYWIGLVEACQRTLAKATRWPIWLSSRETSTMVVMGSGVLTMALSLVWSMSRSAIVCFISAMLAFGWLIARRQGTSRWWRAAGGAALAALVAAAVAWRGGGRIAAWFMDTADLHGRLAAWRDTWRVIQDFPLVGTGLNTFSSAMLFYQQSNAGFHLGSAHNDYLQLLAEGGFLLVIPAVVAAIGLVLAIHQNIRAARHERRGYWVRAGAAVALLAMALQEAVEFSLQIPANALLFCTLAAIALAPVQVQR